jgi:hypothetical protein
LKAKLDQGIIDQPQFDKESEKSVAYAAWNNNMLYWDE